MLFEVLAKSNPKQTLLEHTDDCIKWFSKVLLWNKEVISKMSGLYDISSEILIQRLFITVAFHDIGKATLEFQNKINGNETNVLQSHALSSVPLLFELLKDSPILKFEGVPFYPEILAVASHHSRLSKKLFEHFNNNIIQFVEKQYISSFINHINDLAKQLNIVGWKDLNTSIYINTNEPFEIFKYDVLLNLEEDGYRYANADKIRDIFILFKATLHYCDWLASSRKTNFDFSTKETVDSLYEKIKQNKQNFKGLYPFQQKSAVKGNNHILVQIPTGQGKTEASAFWAVNSNQNQKILYLLPTMVTTNKMWERIRFLFGGDDNVGLSHSTAQYILKDKCAEFESESLRQHFLYNRTFFKPVSVATVDQLIYSFFNWGYWTLTNLASYNAKIIIDEIHIYDAYTFGILLEIIHNITPYNSKFAVMSASLPNILVQELKKIIPDFEMISDSNFNNIQRHKIEVSNNYIEFFTNNIKNDYFLNRKVLVVCNTIKKAREIYDEIIDEIPLDKVMLYHSQFILIDKVKKENNLENIQKLKGGFVAICTQIVEVSLDLDFDVLYTENAPIDAIIQRLGRVNRKCEISKRIDKMNYAKVVVAKESIVSHNYVYNKLEKILDNSYIQLRDRSNQKNGNLTELDFKEIVEVVYTKENLGEEYYHTLSEGKSLIRTLWNDYLNKIYTLSVEEVKLQSISSRQISYIKVESVLLEHFERFNFDEVVEKGNYDLLRKYTIKVPLYIAKKYGTRRINNSDVYILDMKYDEFKGLSLEPNDQIIM